MSGRTIDEVLQRGVRRGEIDPSKLTKRTASLPRDILRHEVFMTHKPVLQSAIAEILDIIFLSLVATKKVSSIRESCFRATRVWLLAAKFIRAIDAARKQMMDIEKLSDEELDVLHARYEQLKADSLDEKNPAVGDSGVRAEGVG